MTSIAVGNRRLLRLAKFIEPRKGYDQSRYAHKCGTPACAWGTAVYNTPRLMKLARGFIREFKEEHGTRPSLDTAILFGVGAWDDNHAEEEFALTSEEVDELFSEDGCGNAGKSAKKAAAYIRAFVKRRQKVRS